MYDILNEHLQELKENIRIGLGSIEIKVQEGVLSAMAEM